MSTLPPALAHVLTLRGFAWADELRPGPSGTGTLSILSSSGEVVGTADVPLAPNTPDDTFSLFDKIVPLTDQARSATLVRLEQTELDLLIAVLPALDEGARQHLLPRLDEGNNAITLFDSPTQSLAALTRKERTELLALLRSALHLGQIDSATIPSLRDGLGRIQALRDTVFKDSIRLASVALRAYRGLLDWSTALLAACQGLEIALDRFEPARGFQFSTYAVQWIRHRVGRHRSNLQAPLRLPVHVEESLYHYVTTERTLWTHDGRPSIDAILEALGSERPRIEGKVEHLRPVIDAHLFDDQSSIISFAEQVLDPDLLSMWDGAAPATWPAHALEQIEHAVSTLVGKDRERRADILRERLALRRPGPKTLQEVGEALGITRERVRQLQVVAIRSLRIHNLDHDPWRWRSGS